MGAEIGATTTSIFGYDKNMSNYLKLTGRKEIADLADDMKHSLVSDPEVFDNPNKFYDEVIEINLSDLEPHINGPFTPDVATPISKISKKADLNNWPKKIDVGLIGSCTNSSYEDISRAASIAKQAVKNGISLKSKFTITPGSEQVRKTIERDGLIKIFQDLGANVFANACGPCIGQWNRVGSENEEKNSIIHSFNRNFAKRADGNPNTHAFVASPEIVTAIALSGDLGFNPIKDSLIDKNGEKFKLLEPKGEDLPINGFSPDFKGYKKPANDGSNIKVKIKSNSDRLQMLSPLNHGMAII